MAQLYVTSLGCMWRDAFTRWRDAFTRWRDAFTCEVCDVMHSYVMRLIHMSRDVFIHAVTDSYVMWCIAMKRDMFIGNMTCCGKRQVHVRHVTFDSFIWGCISRCDMTRLCQLAEFEKIGSTVHACDLWLESLTWGRYWFICTWIFIFIHIYIYIYVYIYYIHDMTHLCRLAQFEKADGAVGQDGWVKFLKVSYIVTSCCKFSGKLTFETFYHDFCRREAAILCRRLLLDGSRFLWMTQCPVTWLDHVCAMTRSWVTWLVCMCDMKTAACWKSFSCNDAMPCDMIRSYVCRDLCTCVPWLVHAWRDSCLYVTWGQLLAESCQHWMTLCPVTWLIQVCDMTRSRVCRD